MYQKIFSEVSCFTENSLVSLKTVAIATRINKKQTNKQNNWKFFLLEIRSDTAKIKIINKQTCFFRDFQCHQVLDKFQKISMKFHRQIQEKSRKVRSQEASVILKNILVKSQIGPLVLLGLKKRGKIMLGQGQRNMTFHQSDESIRSSSLPVSW